MTFKSVRHWCGSSCKIQRMIIDVSGFFQDISARIVELTLGETPRSHIILQPNHHSMFTHRKLFAILGYKLWMLLTGMSSRST